MTAEQQAPRTEANHLTSIFKDADRLRAYFMERGWSIHMEDNARAVVDPFVAIIEAGEAARPLPEPQPDLELLRDLVQHWDAGDIDHDYDSITSAFDSARNRVRSTVGLAGEHRHPAGALPDRPEPSLNGAAHGSHICDTCRQPHLNTALDVERLAEALGVVIGDELDVQDFSLIAQAAAAEYQRLSQPPDPATAHEVKTQVIEGYVDPSGRGEGNWSSEK